MSLRNEIIESEKARSELLKWKLVGVATLAALGLGFTENGSESGAHLVLPVIPFVCFYVDLMCRHESLRILVIAAFMRSRSNRDDADYESFVQVVARSPGRNFFALEDWALEGSTMALALLLVTVGIVPQLVPGTLERLNTPDFRWFSVASGVTVFALTLLVRRFFSTRSRVLNEFAGSGVAVAGLRPDAP
jgi:hypothetical protein